MVSAEIQSTDLLIFGDGFSARIIRDKIGPKYKYLSAVPIFDNGEFYKLQEGSSIENWSLNSTNQVGGGISMWGGALSFPNENHFFSLKDEGPWNIFLTNALNTFNQDLWNSFFKNSPSLFSRFWKCFLGTFLKSDSLQVETHGYIDNRFDSIRKNIFLQRDRNFIEFRDLSFEEDSLQTGFRVRFTDKDGHIQHVRPNKMIFAAGNIGNAYLVSKLTGTDQFPIGNHLSTSVATISLRFPLFLYGLTQRWEKGERSFLTFSLNRSYRQSHDSHSSLRLIAVPPKSLKNEFLRKLLSFRNSPSRKVLFQLFWVVADGVSSLLTKRRLTYEFEVRLLVDIDPNSAILHFSGENGRDVAVRIMSSQAKFSEASQLLYAFFSKVHKLFLVSSVSIKDSSERLKPFSEEWLSSLNWSDAAHYYGSIPLIDESMYLRIREKVTEEMELVGFPNVFVVGGSAIPVGHHGHPTYLIAVLSHFFAQHI